MGTDLPQLLFIGGSGRSGTTLVQKILCAHSRVIGGPEFDNLSPIMRLHAQMRKPSSLTRQAWYYGESELDEAIREFVFGLLSLPGKRAGRLRTSTYIAEKTPSNIDVAEPLLRLFPDSRFINLVRDGRDVAFSHMKIADRMRQKHGVGRIRQKWLDEFGLRASSRRWRANVQTAVGIEGSAEESIRSRFLTVRYESLVSQPVEEIARMCAFLGIDVEQLMLHPEAVQAEATGQAINIDEIWYTQAQYSQPFNQNSVGSWLGMGWADRIAANFLMADELRALGYRVADGYLLARKGINRLRGRRG